jgi:hypothetical protein
MPARWRNWAMSSPSKASPWTSSRSRWYSSGQRLNLSVLCVCSSALWATIVASSVTMGPSLHHYPSCCGRKASIAARRPQRHSRPSSMHSQQRQSCNCLILSRRLSSNATHLGPVSMRYFIKAQDPSHSSASRLLLTTSS